MGATVHSASRIAAVSGRKSGISPASISLLSGRRASRSSCRRGSKSFSPVSIRNRTASGVQDLGSHFRCAVWFVVVMRNIVSRSAETSTAAR